MRLPSQVTLSTHMHRSPLAWFRRKMSDDVSVGRTCGCLRVWHELSSLSAFHRPSIQERFTQYPLNSTDVLLQIYYHYKQFFGETGRCLDAVIAGILSVSSYQLCECLLRRGGKAGADCSGRVDGELVFTPPPTTTTTTTTTTVSKFIESMGLVISAERKLS